MDPITFEWLLQQVAPRIAKSSLRNEAIDPVERFSATLRYLVTGDAQVTISLNYRMSPTIIGRNLFETCQVIWDVLSKEGFMTAPNSETEWENVSWNI